MNRTLKILTTALMISLAPLAYADDGTSDGGGDTCNADPQAEFRYTCHVYMIENGEDKGIFFEFTDKDVPEATYTFTKNDLDQTSAFKDVEVRFDFCHATAPNHSLIYHETKAHFRPGQPLEGLDSFGAGHSIEPSVDASAKATLPGGNHFEMITTCYQESWTPKARR